MIDSHKHADDTQLTLLLYGDERGDDYRNVWTHVESCDACRARLDEVSDCEGFDERLRDMLSRDCETAATPIAPNTEAAPEFLSPPAHPEMLGRLGRYEIERVLARGGMGVVLKGHDTELNRPVAIKVLAQHLAHSGAARQRFAREARAAAAVVHEHVVAIFNVETNGEHPFLVMPYVAGESLQERIDREGALRLEEMLRIGAQAAAGLHAAHEQGVVHRDVKPGNILLEGGVERALVTDFGLAQTIDEASLTRTGIVTGTPNYMSPEQATGQGVDARSDLFSLGAVLYFMATGRPPFRAEAALGVLHRVCNEKHTPLWRDHPGVPDDLSDLVDRLLEKNPARRPASAEWVHDRLCSILSSVQQPRRRRAAWLKRLVRRHQHALRMGAVAAVIAVGAAVALPLMSKPTPTQPAQQTTNTPKPTMTFSPEVWRQASAQEALEWQAAVREFDGMLKHFESGARVERDWSEWTSETQALRQQINEYESAYGAP